MKKIMLMLALSLMLCLGLTACGDGTEKNNDGSYTLRMSTSMVPGTPVYDSSEWFVERVSELTEGNVQIDLYGSGELGDYLSTFSEIMSGSIDLSWDTASGEYSPEAYIVQAPYLVTNWNEVEYAMDRDSELGKYVGNAYKEIGVEQIGVGSTGFYGIGGQDLGDLDTIFDPNVQQKGVLCRTPALNSSIAAVEALGYTPTTINYSDLYSALQTGAADCWYGGDPTLNYQSFRDVITYYAAYDCLVEYYPLIISSKTWDNLPEEYQMALMQAGEEATDICRENAKKLHEEALVNLEEAGIEILTPTDEELKKLTESVRKTAWKSIEEGMEIEGAEQFLWDFIEQMHTDLGEK